MANSNNSNKKLVPEAMEALDRFGRIGGNMVKKMIQQVENNMANK